jgi:hypothetical protein
MKIKTPATSISKDNVVIGKEIAGKDDKSTVFLCEWCNCVLSRLIDHSGQNPSLFCSRCQMSFDPQYDNLRHESKITIPHEDIEPAITSIGANMAEEVEIRHSVPIRGGFAELEKKGIRIKDYHTTEKT